jgi:octaprenyl-diphosphate synthase
MGHKEITALVGDDLKLVEKSILENFQSNVTIIPLISNYLTNGGGKRLRPILVLLTSKLFGCRDSRDPVVHSTVVEYIHAATLLHDDVVDAADIRRGLKSVNAKWGNGYSVLVGDYLFAKSFALMAERSSAEIINAVSVATQFLAEGEIQQLVHRYDPEVTEEEYLDIVFRKTGALITACCQIGAFLGKS